MSTEIRVGLVGLGTIGQTHLAVLAERPEVSLSFVVDVDQSRPAPFRDDSAPRYEHTVEALEEHDPDLVVVATPISTHADIACEVLSGTTARVLVEKPFVHDQAAMSQVESMGTTVDLHQRVWVAHHFGFAPEVMWAAGLTSENTEWGPLTGLTAAFHDPYTADLEHSLSSYTSSWMDSGPNQLSVLARFLDPRVLGAANGVDNSTTSWFTAEFPAGDGAGLARLLTSWETGASSKRTTLTFADSGVEVWLDHTAMTAFAVRGDELLATLSSDGRTSRKIAHYRPLYDSLLGVSPDPILGFETAAAFVDILDRARTQ